MTGSTVLLVEDNERNRKLLRDLLAHLGHRVVEAATGEEGVERALAESPALIFMDIQLPDIDGIEALARIRSEPATSEIPVVAVTASAMRDERVRIEAAGFTRYLAKPVDIDEVLAVVDEFLGGAAPAG